MEAARKQSPSPALRKALHLLQSSCRLDGKEEGVPEGGSSSSFASMGSSYSLLQKSTAAGAALSPGEQLPLERMWVQEVQQLEATLLASAAEAVKV